MKKILLLIFVSLLIGCTNSNFDDTGIVKEGNEESQVSYASSIMTSEGIVMNGSKLEFELEVSSSERDSITRLSVMVNKNLVDSSINNSDFSLSHDIPADGNKNNLTFVVDMMDSDKLMDSTISVIRTSIPKDIDNTEIKGTFFYISGPFDDYVFKNSNVTSNHEEYNTQGTLLQDIENNLRESIESKYKDLGNSDIQHSLISNSNFPVDSSIIGSTELLFYNPTDSQKNLDVFILKNGDFISQDRKPNFKFILEPNHVFTSDLNDLIDEEAYYTILFFLDGDLIQSNPPIKIVSNLSK